MISVKTLNLSLLSAIAKLEPYRFFEYDPETQQYVFIQAHEDIMQFLLAYKASPEVSRAEIILWLVDSRTTCFLTNDSQHMFVNLDCKMTISRVGKQISKKNAPLLLSFVSDDLTYVSLTGTDVFWMPSMPFLLFSTGYAERRGFKFDLNWHNPTMISSDGRRVQIIKDQNTGFT